MFKPLLYLIIALCILVYTKSSDNAASYSPPPDVHKLLNISEKFTYEVRYGFFNLGTVTISILSDTTYRGEPAHYLFYHVKSNPIPLIGHKERNYHTFMAHNDTTFYGLKFWTDSVHDDMYGDQVYDFDYQKGKVYTFEEDDDHVITRDTLELNELADSGPVIFYFSRLHAGTNRKVNYPVYISHEKGNVMLQNYDEIISYSSGAFPGGDVDAYKTIGNADVDGPFGFSGRIEAIYKADELRIPLEARIKVWLGNVRVRLTDYEIENERTETMP